jgi:plastocyanin
MKARFLVFALALSLAALAGPAYARPDLHAGLHSAALAGPDAGPAAQVRQPAAVYTIHFGGLLGAAYSPADVVIAPGDTVTWQGDFLTHPLVSDEALWTPVASGAQFSHIFTQPGLYHFHCQVHGLLFNMRGTVLVAYRDYLPFARK